MKTAVIVGATSGIAHALSREIAKHEETKFYLVGRDNKSLTECKSDIEARSKSQAKTVVLNFEDYAHHSSWAQKLTQECGQIDYLVVAHGFLGDQKKAETDSGLAAEIATSNYTTYISILSAFTPIFMQQKTGRIVVFGSVAGDRGRKSIYTYGSAKAGVAVFVEGLGYRMAEFGVSVSLVKPGPVATRMTAHLKKGLLMADPATVAKHIYKRVQCGCTVIYTPFFWRYIMCVIRALPKFVMKRMNF